MRHLILVLTLASSVAYANPVTHLGGAFFWRGVSGNSCPAYASQFQGFDADCDDYPAQQGFGGETQFLLGGTWWKGLAVFGFSRVSNEEGTEFRYGNYSNGYERFLVTRSYQILAGARLHPQQTTRSPLVPFIGGGGTLSLVERRYEYRSFQNDESVSEESQTASSKPAPGFYVEAGFVIRIANGALVSLAARAQYVNYHVVGPYAVDHDEELAAMFMLGYVHPLR